MNINKVIDRPVGDAQLIEDLRLQIQRLQHRLCIYEKEQAMEDHDEEENLFHQDDDSDDDTSPHPQGVA